MLLYLGTLYYYVRTLKKRVYALYYYNYDEQYITDRHLKKTNSDGKSFENPIHVITKYNIYNNN